MNKIIILDKGIANYLDAAVPGVVHGDTASVFLTRQLLQIEARVYEVKYAELPFRNLFPVSHEMNEGAITGEYHVADKVGAAKFIGSYADDVPMADAFMKAVQFKLKAFASGFQYNTEEIRNARFAQRPLEQLKANATKRAIEELFNSVAFVGDADNGILGFLTNPNITLTVAANGATSGNPLWSGKTPDEILFDVNSLGSAIWASTLMVEKPNTLLLPPAQYSFINDTPRSSVSDTTILSFILNNSMFFNKPGGIIPVNQMTGSGPGGTDQMVAYDRSPEKLKAHIPMEQRFHPVERRNLNFRVATEAKTGGVVIMYPASVATASGI